MQYEFTYSPLRRLTYFAPIFTKYRNLSFSHHITCFNWFSVHEMCYFVHSIGFFQCFVPSKGFLRKILRFRPTSIRFFRTFVEFTKTSSFISFKPSGITWNLYILNLLYSSIINRCCARFLDLFVFV